MDCGGIYLAYRGLRFVQEESCTAQRVGFHLAQGDSPAPMGGGGEGGVDAVSFWGDMLATNLEQMGLHWQAPTLCMAHAQGTASQH